ncbi:MAG: hypothetical protein LJE96_11555 [Deltaproteobacteria bacterium]|nr:hypothetical protein [Deltaproteobacteria bacterium]
MKHSTTLLLRHSGFPFLSAEFPVLLTGERYFFKKARSKKPIPEISAIVFAIGGKIKYE